ncbi:glycosyltransferase [Massilia sp. TS11]|uniref:glycosyltransferase n=1 Tax=Massilia sp. TS11 TaxID=2908003 RepID=UPI001EDA3546|nr:glycosyltransferase [Massilia sp. TS11]MCG2586628.1 glycosyltransferase [Massilia sp. TS11]
MQAIRRALVMAVGSGGDVAPFAAVAAQLAARGLDTTLMAPQRYAPYVAGSGVAFVSIGAEDVFTRVFDGADIWDARRGLAASWTYYDAAMRSAYPMVRAGWHARDTLLLSSSFAVAARLAEERDGFRNCTVHLSPSIIFSAEAPPRWPLLSIPPHWPLGLRRFLMRLSERVGTEPLLGRYINAFRAELGLAPQRWLLSHWIHSPAQVLYAFPSWFAEPAGDWPAQGQCAGFPLARLGQTSLPADVADWLGGEAVLITAGTAVAQRPAWVTRAIAAVRARGWRALVVEPQPGPAQDDVLSLPFLPFDAVLPHVKGIVHHAGIGTALAAMRAGVPQLLQPSAHDQPDNAARLVALGVARPLSAPEAWDWLSAGPTQALTQVVRARLAREGDGAARIAEMALAHAHHRSL